MNDVIKLNDGDWDEIFNIKIFKIGKTSLPIKALPIGELVEIGAIIAQASESSIKNIPIFQDPKLTIPEKIIKCLPMVAGIITEEFPQVVCEMAKLDVEDFKKLPAVMQVDLALVCIDANIESMESLAKNFGTLIVKAQTLSQGMSNMGLNKKKTIAKK